MGRPVRIQDLARRLLALAEEQGVPTVPIAYIGLRPGEKLDEQLTVRGMDLSRTDHARIWIAKNGPVDAGAIRRIVRSLRADLARGDGLAALTDLQAAVPEYEPSEDARRAAGTITLNSTFDFDDPRDRLVA
jgi:FlaA1/EpsC-like NDP-sugar epimerase